MNLRTNDNIIEVNENVINKSKLLTYLNELDKMDKSNEHNKKFEMNCDIRSHEEIENFLSMVSNGVYDLKICFESFITLALYFDVDEAISQIHNILTNTFDEETRQKLILHHYKILKSVGTQINLINMYDSLSNIKDSLSNEIKLDMDSYLTDTNIENTYTTLINNYEKLQLETKLDVDCYFQQHKFHSYSDKSVANYVKNKNKNLVDVENFNMVYYDLTFGLIDLITNNHILNSECPELAKMFGTKLFHAGGLLNDIVNTRIRDGYVDIDLFYIDVKNTIPEIYDKKIFSNIGINNIMNMLNNIHNYDLKVYVACLIIRLREQYTLKVITNNEITTIIINEIPRSIQIIDLSEENFLHYTTIEDLLDDFDFSHLKMFYPASFNTRELMISSECLKAQISRSTIMYNNKETRIIKVLNAGFRISNYNENTSKECLKERVEIIDSIDSINSIISINQNDIHSVREYSTASVYFNGIEIQTVVHDPNYPIKCYLIDNAYISSSYNFTNIMFHDRALMIMHDVLFLGYLEFDACIDMGPGCCVLLGFDKTNINWRFFKKYIKTSLIRKITTQTRKTRLKRYEGNDVYTILDMMEKDDELLYENMKDDKINIVNRLSQKYKKEIIMVQCVCKKYEEFLTAKNINHNLSLQRNSLQRNSSQEYETDHNVVVLRGDVVLNNIVVFDNVYRDIHTFVQIHNVSNMRIDESF